MKNKKQTPVKWLVNRIFGKHTEQWQKEIDYAISLEEHESLYIFKNGYDLGFDQCKKGKERIMNVSDLRKKLNKIK